MTRRGGGWTLVGASVVAWATAASCGPREAPNVPAGPPPQYEAPPARQWELTRPAGDDALDELIDSAIEEPTAPAPAPVDAGAPPAESVSG